MIEYYTALYLDWLSDEIKTPHGIKPRSRYAKYWDKFEPILNYRTELDLNAVLEDAIAARSIANYRGRQVWTWSDQHFGHKNILRFSDRPFPNLELMEQCMVENYNQLVQPEDICIWVGDVAFLKDAAANEILARCNGYKILVVGNHDMQGRKLKKLDFEEIHLAKHVEMVYNHRTYDFVFTHYPFGNIPKPGFNVHGHEHVAFQHTKTEQHINVNCELTNYKPVNMIDTILTIAANRREHIE